MKKIIIKSHKIENTNLYKKKCLNGDEYDSEIIVMKDNETLWKGVCNVDSSNELKYKIEIENREYWGIVGMHKARYKAILITNNIPTKEWTKLTEKERTLPTIQENPKWKKKIAKFINIHKGGDASDWSEGCITIHKSDYDDFIKHFEYNEILKIEKI